MIVSGTRAEDMRLRLKYAGADENAVRIVRGVAELADAVAGISGDGVHHADVHGHAAAARGARRPRGQKGVLEIMELRICHLYPDVLNLYGDRGNVLRMKKRLEWRGIGCAVTELPIGERAPSRSSTSSSSAAGRTSSRACSWTTCAPARART